MGVPTHRQTGQTVHVLVEQCRACLFCCKEVSQHCTEDLAREGCELRALKLPLPRCSKLLTCATKCNLHHPQPKSNTVFQTPVSNARVWHKLTCVTSPSGSDATSQYCSTQCLDLLRCQLHCAPPPNPPPTPLICCQQCLISPAQKQKVDSYSPHPWL
jgi:hypothetical protein